MVSTISNGQNQPWDHAKVAAPARAMDMNIAAIMVKLRPADLPSSMGEERGMAFPKRPGISA